MASWLRTSLAITMSAGMGMDIPTASPAPRSRSPLASLLCDVYDAMTHDKAYRRALSSHEAVAEISRGRGLQFDPMLIDAFGPLITRLRAEHADLDAFLGQAARQTALTVARQKIAESLAAGGVVSLSGPPR